MKKIRWITGILSIVCLLYFVVTGTDVLTVYGASDGSVTYVVDQADILSPQEEQAIETRIEEMSQKWKQDFVVVTTNDAEGKDSEEYADDFYMDHGFYDDGKKGGITMLIDMDNREVWISTAGDMRYYVSDREVEEILDAGYDNLKRGEMYSCFANMLISTDEVVDRGLSSDDYLIDENGNIIRYHSLKLWEIILALAAAILAAVVPCAVVLGKYTVHFGGYVYNWRENSLVAFSDKQDRFLNQIVTHRHIPKNPPPGGGGSAGGGGSSVHTSSGGGSFGGGGRNF